MSRELEAYCADAEKPSISSRSLRPNTKPREKGSNTVLNQLRKSGILPFLVLLGRDQLRISGDRLRKDLVGGTRFQSIPLPF
jgi:hypothetical protein